MEKNNLKNLSLRIFASIIMLVIVVFFILMAAFVTKRLHSDHSGLAVEGYLKLNNDMAVDAPVYLNGEWEVLYDGVIQTESELNSLETSGSYIDFPVGSIVEATTDATYRLYFSFPTAPIETIYLAIPTFEGRVDVFLNGRKQSPLSSNEEWIASSTLQFLVPLSGIDMGRDWQELVISGDFSNRAVTLFQRPIVFGTLKNIFALTTFDGYAELFAFGILVLIIVNGCVFMLFRPGHLVISMLTLFDATILARIFFSLKFTLGVVKSIFPGLVISDAFCRSAEFFFLMLGGIVGCILSGLLYDPKGKVPRWLTWVAPAIYGGFAVFFSFNMDLFERFGSILLIGVYFLTFIVVFMQYSVSWRTEERRVYYLLQFTRTCYIGMVVFCDIMFWSKYKDFSLLLYAYVIFFIMHVIIRLHDNNQSYHDVEKLNQSLEATVEERTTELLRANQILSELSIRDPLTNIFNRLYFEKAIEAEIGKRSTEEQSMHLCIFDLDLFKRVNDSYGHHVGDEVLKRATEVVKEAIDEDVVFARIGGEEFILLFYGCEDEEVLSRVNDVRQALENNAKLNEKHTTASFGISAWRPGDTQKTMLKSADKALYEAKKAGRNCVVFDERTT